MEGRELLRKIRGDKIHHIRSPLAHRDVQKGSARSIAIFHAGMAGEPEIQIVVWQQNGRGLFPVRGLVLPEPENFWSRVAGKHRVPDALDDLTGSPEMPCDLSALGGGRCVAPELGRSNDISFAIQWNEPVLLAADSDPPDVGFPCPQLFEHHAHGGLRCGDPLRRILLHGTGGKARQESVGLVR